MTDITYGTFDLQSSTIVISDIQHENMIQKKMNIQRFSLIEGGRFARPDFDVKVISMKGHIKGTSKADLEGKIDAMKKALNKDGQNLDIEYTTGTRRYICSCSKMSFSRAFYTIDYIEFELEFVANDPPLGTNLDTSTLEYLGRTNTFASTMTGETDLTLDYAGTFRPLPIIRMTFNSANGIRRVSFENYDGNQDFSSTIVENYKFYDGDVLEINTKEGWVRVNGIDIESTFGYPNFTLDNNDMAVTIIGKSYNVDIKFIYYPLWI